MGPVEPIVVLEDELAALVEQAYDALGERTARVLTWHLRTTSKIDKVPG